MTISLNYQRFVETMQEQAAIGATENGGLHRLTLSDEDKQVRDWLVEQMEAESLSIRVDAFGNMFGRRDDINDTASVLVGSHLDSQPHGEIYDGALGVISALEFIRELNDQDIETERPIEIVNWTNEEGSRFQPTLQGSGVWAGIRDLDDEYAKTDSDGISVEAELERIGYKGEYLAEPYEEYDSYLEQGPYLDDVGIVTGIVGLRWGAITYRGEANPSGATPMHRRSDALVATNDVMTQVRRIPTNLGQRTVGTVGAVDVHPNSINVIPGEVTFTYGFRDPSKEVLEKAHEQLLFEAETAAEREDVNWNWEQPATADPVHFSGRCINAVERAATELGYDSQRIFSRGVHDARHANEVCDTGMVFAVSEEGKSHTEEEYTNWDDCYSGANTLATAALSFAMNDV